MIATTRGSPQFPYPKWNKEAQRLDFTGIPLEQHEEAAKYFLSKISDMLNDDARGLTNRKRERLSFMSRQLATFLGAGAGN
jgi:hypothetical protein